MLLHLAQSVFISHFGVPRILHVPLSYYISFFLSVNLVPQLRYLDALDCDGMELELTNTPYRVNAWSKTQVDIVAELDMLEHDPPCFGKFQVLFTTSSLFFSHTALLTIGSF